MLGNRRLSRSMKQLQSRAKGRLRRYRQGTMLAVAITALLLMIGGQGGNVAAQEDTEPGILETVKVPESQGMALEESVETIRQLMATGYAFCPGF